MLRFELILSQAVLSVVFSLVNQPGLLVNDASAADFDPFPGHELNRWVKRTPLVSTPVSPRLGYEGACVWDSTHKVVIRYGGHNQGGGGEQGAELWTLDLQTARWRLHEPNMSPPGVCCNSQNVFHPGQGRYLRFPLFSGNHGWQWWRELYLNDSSVWTYDLGQNRWRNLRPLPAPKLAGLRCASWDTDEKVVVVFGGEGSSEGTLIYDPQRNEWRWPKPRSQPEFRSGGTMAYDQARKLHILFGSQFIDDPHTWAYDVKSNEWRDMKPPAQPLTNKNDAVLTYDPGQKVILAIIKSSTGTEDAATHELQTWTYDAGANHWQRRNPITEPDPSGNRARNLMFAPELNLAILENCPSKPREQQIWTYRLSDSALTASSSPAHEPISFVEDVVVSVVGPRRIEVTWTVPESAAQQREVMYHVERAAVEVYSDDQLQYLKRRTAPLPSPSVGALRKIGPFERITDKPVTETSFSDASIDLNQPQTVQGDLTFDRALHSEHRDDAGRPYPKAVYAYRIRRFGPDGELSGPSPATLSIPASPQDVFSRENDTECQLKWSANREKGIVGYRIYRMDGRYDKEMISRLTDDPQAATTFSDPTAGKSTRRYYVVAVDAIGQEGFPSSPVWHKREWRDFYAPFVGEWRQ